MGYVYHLLLREKLALSDNMALTVQILQWFGWILNKLLLEPNPHLAYLGLVLALRFCTRVLPLIVATFKAVQFAQFYYRLLLCNILSLWGKSIKSLDRQVHLETRNKLSLAWWLRNATLKFGKSFLPILTMDGSLLGYGEVPGNLSEPGAWLSEKP